MLVLTGFPENYMKNERNLCQNVLKHGSRYTFPQIAGGCSLWYRAEPSVDGLEVSMLQPPSLVKTLKRLFVIPGLWEGLTFPIGSWSTSSGALCPLHLLWFAQLKWDKARGGLWKFTREFYWSHIQRFSDRRFTVYCRFAIASGDWWITLLHTFTQEIEAWR